MDATILLTVVEMIYLWNHLRRHNAQMHKQVFQFFSLQVFSYRHGGDLIFS
jgi:hypothetical protein